MDSALRISLTPLLVNDGFLSSNLSPKLFVASLADVENGFDKGVVTNVGEVGDSRTALGEIDAGTLPANPDTLLLTLAMLLSTEVERPAAAIPAAVFSDVIIGAPGVGDLALKRGWSTLPPPSTVLGLEGDIDLESKRALAV